MDFKANIPIYLQVIQDIKSNIINGTIELGAKLPGSRELALSYGINPNTAARIYSELEAEGISFTRRGIGTFVTNDITLIDTLKKEFLENAINEFTERISCLGYDKDEIITLLSNFYKEHP